MKNNLNIDEVLALVMMGKTAKEIRQIDLATFDMLYDENPEIEEHIYKANSILDRQEAQGIFSISCQDADFPERLLKIGQDCSAVIFIVKETLSCSKNQRRLLLSVRGLPTAKVMIKPTILVKITLKMVMSSSADLLSVVILPLIVVALMRAAKQLLLSVMV